MKVYEKKSGQWAFIIEKKYQKINRKMRALLKYESETGEKKKIRWVNACNGCTHTAPKIMFIFRYIMALEYKWMRK